MTQPLADTPAVALTIAGFDPSSGAGVTADLMTFAAHGVFGCACPTAMTVQSTQGVRRSEPLNGRLVTDALEALADDFVIDGVKIGMLGTREVTEAVCTFLEQGRRAVVVLDPVLRASSGAELLRVDALAVVRERLLPLVDVATPNRGELFALLGEERRDEALEEAGGRLLSRYPRLGLVVTGGDETRPDDLVLECGAEAAWLRGEHIATTATHGSGCAFSTALLCSLLAGEGLLRSAQAAKQFVEGAMRSAPRLGQGRGPMDLLWTRKNAAKVSTASADTDGTEAVPT